MQYGADINSKHGDGHAVLDRAWANGERFVAIKCGGGNVGLYQAPNYATQVAYARSKGFRICHYFVSGNQSIAAQTREALAIIKPHWRDGDAIAYDNERLNTTGMTRNDADTTLWVNTVRGTGGVNCPPAAVWVYGSSGSTFRVIGRWPRLAATKATIWVAAYPGPPSMSGTGLTCGVHQYTSSFRYGDGQVTDRSQTSRSLDALFPRRAAVSPVAGGKPTSGLIPKTSTAITGGPGKAGSYCWKRMQLLGSLAKGPHRYVGPKDGDLGVFSWMGVQQRLTDLGFYRGTVDGEPYTLTIDALQAWAGIAKAARTVTGDPLKISRANWRAIGRKLNTL